MTEVLSLIQRELLRHHVSLRLQLARRLPQLFADRIQLQQVIINLIMNGIQSMDEVCNRPRELTIESRPGLKGTVVVAVRDSGIGIPAENADRLFDAFFTTKPQGMGMGLSICRSIVEAHGGSIVAINNDGYGATFECALPQRPNSSLARTAACGFLNRESIVDWRMGNERLEFGHGLGQPREIRARATQCTVALPHRFQRFSDIEQPPVAAEGSDDLHAERHAGMIGSARQRYRRIRHQRHQIGQREPSIVVGQRPSIDLAEIRL